MDSRSTRITSEQMRAARGLLGWTQQDLAGKSEISIATVKRLEAEAGPLGGLKITATAIRRAFEDAGVVFIDANGGGAGVRFRDPPPSL
ncbi:helix-turn-helix domain-containing protein [Salinarimonas ramus]|uniref:Transcriptional regulator n=1 Tax=Salinarimonas ramus TaxID=690164 RepID=A0A917Q7D9_9HYPH|nr:transcriptional regulator [Salinarimonas ramus]GGK31424.1 transcriptional regulator [Salinarimonas ramus]